MSSLRDDNYDLYRMVAKPLYLGMFTNVLLPAGLLLICYYAAQNFWVENKLGDSANLTYYVICAISLLQAAAALVIRLKRFKEPMIRREETFEADITSGMLNRLRPIFLMIAAVAGYGMLYFYLTGRFNESAFLVVFSFIVFQVVRPRIGMVRKLIEHQTELVKAGKFAPRALDLPD